ncbi:uncharacterized protein [Rutidosis leptorrhynchoides]|uniref:uncharacterized protein isoform X2 n=1 Tax=Rutidosis leptorrhynchoides TaxID=125765 RepID=UPI003A996451
MDKNKNRTDLLAAGRKKLQQYRQKKDGKGSKSSGKGSKPDFDVVTEESSSIGKPTKGKKHVAATEATVQHSSTEDVDLSSADVATQDISTSSLPIEISEAGESVGHSGPDENQQCSNRDDEIPTQRDDELPTHHDDEMLTHRDDEMPTHHVDEIPTVSSSRTVDVEEKPETGDEPVTPVGLKAVLHGNFSRKAGEFKDASGEDQEDNHSSLIDLEVAERAQVNSGDVDEDIKMDYTVSTTEQIIENEDSGSNKADPNSLSVITSSDSEHTIQPKEETVAGFQGDEELPPTSGDYVVNPVSLTQLAKALQILGEDEFRFVMAERDSCLGRDVKKDGDIKSGSIEFSDRLKDQLYINSYEKELMYLQLCEDSNKRAELDNEKVFLNASLGDVEEKNKILSEDLIKCRAELDRVTGEMEKLQMQFSFSKTEMDRCSARIEEFQVELERSEHQLSNVSSELVDSRSLLSDLQAKNENLNVKVASLTEEKQKKEMEKDGEILKNEKLTKEIMELKSLMELSQAENVDLKERFALVMEEKAKLENEKEIFVSEKESLLTELVESKRLIEALQGLNANSNEDKSKLEEANKHYVEENKKYAMEILESQHLVESLRSEVANFENEKTRLGDEISHLIVEKEEALTKLTNSKTLMKDLQTEYEKSMAALKDGAQRIEQLTVENVTLTSNLEVYREKISEFDDWKMKSEQRDFQESISIQDNSQHLVEGSDPKLEEQISNLEETLIKHVILDEFVKQYVFTVEAKKGELIDLCEDLRQEGTTIKTKNFELTEKLCNSESRISALQAEVDELQQLETIYRKLDTSIGLIETSVDQNISTRVATSVNQALAVIHDLHGKLEDALRKHDMLSDSYKEMTEKVKDLEGRNELASYVIHKVFDNLQKIVDDIGPFTQENEDDTTKEELDHLEISNYDIFIEKLIMMLHERAQLESKNREYNVELLRKMKDLEELNKRCVGPDVIVKLFEDIQSSVTLDDIEIKPDEPASSLESLIHSLVKNLKTNEMRSIDMQNELDHLTFSIVSYEIESHILKGSLMSAMEQLVTVQSEVQSKEKELHQSEQRVSALREKLHIAVTKGKGLIQQRDTLKQNLTATSSELDKCLHELQLKDATLQETETKLKNYSEAGERMEALESELSYIRNSATALRESFLLKDSVLQRIEEILEDLDLPEDFHVRDIIEKIDWLAKSVSQNPFPVSNSDQTGSIPIERTRSYPGSVSRALDGWREDLEPTVSSDDELRRNYEELQNKFYELAEQNEMLEQSLMERNNLVIRWEEVLDKINMPQQLRSLDPEDRIEWLRVALLEANDRCDLLQQDIHDLEKTRETSAADLEESQRRLVDLDSAVKSTTDEREQLFASLEVRNQDYDKICEKVALYETEIDKLKNEVGALQLKLDEKLSNEVASYQTEIGKLENEVSELQLRLDEKHADKEHMDHLNGEIRRLQNLVKNMLQVPQTEAPDSNSNDIQFLEGLLNELAEKHITETTRLTHGERSVDLSNMNEELGKKLEEVEGDLARVKDERDKHVEKSQSLVLEIESLQIKNKEMQNSLVQEEQKTAAVKEKLNVAVRKGKSLVQVRDSMKQTISDLTSQVERLTAEIKVRENTILEFQQKMKDLFTSQELVETKESEIQFLKNRLEEANGELQDKTNTLSMILRALGEIDLGVDFKTNDPFEKMKQIVKVLQDLEDAMSSSEQDSRKSKRAAELLLAELNEVQERNEDLLEELSKITMERDSVEAANRESLTRIEQLSALHLEERNSQFTELMNLKASLDQLRPGLSKIYNIISDVLPKDLDHLYNLEASINSLLESSDASNVGGQTLSSSHGGISLRPEFKVSKTEELHKDNQIIDSWRFIGSHMQDLMNNVNVCEEKLQSYSKFLHEKIVDLSETMSALHQEVTSHKYSIESAKEEIAWLESNGKQNETENVMLHKYISILYEACKNSVLEIEKSKGQIVANDSLGHDIFSGETLTVSEERITSMVNRLLSLVKEFHSVQSENLEVNLKEMKATISNLQRELTEKDVQKDRMCVDLVGQIKRAEAAAMSHLQELETSKTQINDLNGQCKVLEQRVKELEGQEIILVDLHEKVKSLTDALTAKEQENEALLQALDEEEGQMDDLTNKITELEKSVQQKNLDLDNSEAARSKALKKLSVTVSKFDELHHLSETLVSEVDKLQSQLQERDSEISFLRDEITRCTSDSLQALETDKRDLTEIQDILTWLDSMVSGVEMNNTRLDGNKIDQVDECKEVLKKQITSIISDLIDLRQVAQSKDDLLRIERSKVDELIRKRDHLESSLREKQSRLSLHEKDGDSAQGTSTGSEIVEVESVINKWPMQGTSMAPQVRSLRKVNNDQLAISIDDMDSDDKDKLEDDDDDKAHGFKSLTTSKLVPRFTRPVTDFVDGLWVSCDRTLMRQPALRLSLILYWALMHALLAVFVV